MGVTTRPCIEQLQLTGDQLEARVRRLVDVGNVRRVAIKTEHERTLFEVVLPLGTTGEALGPVWGAIGSLGGSLPKCSVVVEREAAWPAEPIGALPAHRLRCAG